TTKKKVSQLSCRLTPGRQSEIGAPREELCPCRKLRLATKETDEERFLDYAGRRVRRSERGRKSRLAPLGMTWVEWDVEEEGWTTQRARSGCAHKPVRVPRWGIPGARP